MYLNNFLTSGHSFDEAEESLAFRFHFINALLLIAVVATLAFVLLDQFGINSLVPAHLFNSKLYGLVSFFTIGYLRRGKQLYMSCAWIMVISTYLIFTSALVFMLQDELRVVWFYIFVVVAYVALGSKVGLAATIASLVTVSATKFVLGTPMSDNAYFTFSLTLSVAAVISHTYSNLASSYFERLAFNIEQLRELASKDPLTGTWNARAFYDMSNKLIQLEHRNAAPYCTLFIDLDHFKTINDQHGHDTGDTVLQAVSNCIAINSRESDIVGRIGGEEFAVFLPNTDVQGARQLAEKLRHSAESLIHTFPNNERRAVTLSIGIAQGESTDRSIADIQKRADKAMYAAKQQGRNRIAEISPAT